MTLNELLSTFQSDTVCVSLCESNNKEIIYFKAVGFESLEDTLQIREVLKWEITSPVSIKVTLKPETTE